MTQWVMVISWGVALFLLAPSIRKFLVDRFRLLEQNLVKRLEAFHIFVELSAIRWVLLLLVGIPFLLGLTVFESIVTALLLMASGIVFAFLVLRYRTDRRTKAIRYQLPSVIELIATSLRSGLSLRSAFSQVTQQSQKPVQQELAILERMQRIGIPLHQALARWAARMPINELKLLAFTVGVSTASGGNLSDALDRLAETLRQHLILEEKVDALTAQGRLQAWVMAALPLVLALALTALDPKSMAPLWTTNNGHLVLAAVGGLELLGLVWIRRIIRIEF